MIALAGLGLVLRLRIEPSARAGWLAGLTLGFLPWIKKEGLTLGILLLAVGFVAARARSDRRRPLVAAILGLCLMAGSALLVETRYLPSGTSSFFAGDWWHRTGQRLHQSTGILGAMGRELLARDWFGFWIVLLIAFLCALRWRAREASAVFGVVLGQTGLYAFTYLATYLDPFAHISASFFRLMSALLPVAVVGIGLLLTRSRAEPATLPSG